VGAITGIVFNNKKTVEVGILPFKNTLLDRWVLVGY
jgi:hypothetical protein